MYVALTDPPIFSIYVKFPGGLNRYKNHHQKSVETNSRYLITIF